MTEFQTIESSELDDVTGGFAFLIPLIGAALGAVQGGMSSKKEGGKIDWKQVASGALGGIGMGGSGAGGSGGSGGSPASSGEAAAPAQQQQPSP